MQNGKGRLRYPRWRPLKIGIEQPQTGTWVRPGRRRVMARKSEPLVLEGSIAVSLVRKVDIIRVKP